VLNRLNNDPRSFVMLMFSLHDDFLESQIKCHNIDSFGEHAASYFEL